MDPTGIMEQLPTLSELFQLAPVVMIVLAIFGSGAVSGYFAGKLARKDERDRDQTIRDDERRTPNP